MKTLSLFRCSKLCPPGQPPRMTTTRAERGFARRCAIVSKNFPWCTINRISSHVWKYEALSSVWGDEQDKLEIMLDNKPFMVTRNLHDFLLQTRPKCGASSVRAGPFWIDAISINQNDNEEKGAQVNMMGDIYRNCERCIVLMGKEKDDSALAFDLMKAVEDYTCYLQADGFKRRLSWKGSHLENRG